MTLKDKYFKQVLTNVFPEAYISNDYIEYNYDRWYYNDWKYIEDLLEKIENRVNSEF